MRDDKKLSGPTEGKNKADILKRKKNSKTIAFPSFLGTNNESYVSDMQKGNQEAEIKTESYHQDLCFAYSVPFGNTMEVLWHTCCNPYVFPTYGIITLALLLHYRMQTPPLHMFAVCGYVWDNNELNVLFPFRELS